MGLGLLVAAFIVNILGNKFIGTFSTVTAVIKIAGIVLFAAGGFWVSGLTFESVGQGRDSATLNKDAMENTQAQGGFTIFPIVDALTRLSQKVTLVGDRMELDAKIGQLLSLALAA